MYNGIVKYPCPRRFTQDCDSEHCSHWGTQGCDPWNGILMDLEASGGRSVKYLCPLYNSSNCDAAHCSMWNTPKCADGYVNTTIKV